jgi:cytochrome oxidase Cu insertion factor (SCO1/SenC/PrrC family)
MRTAILALLCTTAAAVALADDLPRSAPPFTIMRAGAPPIQLSQYHGKLVVLAFIHTTCPHCQALTGTLAPIVRDYTPKNVQFIECAFNQNADQLVPQFIQQLQPAFPVGWSNDAAVRAFLQYSVMDTRMFYVPHMVFLDANGMIRSDYPGEADFFKNPDTNIRAELDKLLKAGAATASHGATTAKKK